MLRRFVLALCCVLPLAATAHGPARQKVEQEITIKAPAAKVWAMVADFCSIEKWHPGVAKCEGTGGNEVGATRTLHVGKADGPVIKEELLIHDAEKMTYKYKITETDVKILPVTTYASFFTVADNGDGSSKVVWKSAFYRSWGKANPPADQSDEAAIKAVTGTLEAGLANLKKLAEK
jgi:carbon monoxide dehydrogenase subunit G